MFNSVFVQKRSEHPFCSRLYVRCGPPDKNDTGLRGSSQVRGEAQMYKQVTTTEGTSVLIETCMWEMWHEGRLRQRQLGLAKEGFIAKEEMELGLGGWVNNPEKSGRLGGATSTCKPWYIQRISAWEAGVRSWLECARSWILLEVAQDTVSPAAAWTSANHLTF